jgi:hypothetical protein
MAGEACRDLLQNEFRRKLFSSFKVGLRFGSVAGWDATGSYPQDNLSRRMAFG